MTWRITRPSSRRRVIQYIFVAVTLCCVSLAAASLMLREDFRAADGSHLPLKELKGATLTKSTVGDILRTDRNARDEMDVDTAISPRGGTLALWIKPECRLISVSHPLVSLRWQDIRYGYLSLSQGWWEPVGTYLLYF